MDELEDDIKRYLKGEMSPGEMYALEKRALQDPFLADALEGAQSVSTADFTSDVEELNERIGKQRSKRSWGMVLRIAAAVVLLLSVSWSIYWFVQTEQPVILSNNTPPNSSSPKQLADSTRKDSIVTKQPEDKHLLSLNQPPPVQTRRKSIEVPGGASKVKPETAKAAGEGNLGPGEQQQAQAESSEVEVLEKPAAEAHDIRSADALDEPLKERKKDAAAPEKVDQLKVASGAALAQPKSQQVVSGKITDADDNQPIPGANVLIKGTTIGAVTDTNGNYQLVTNEPKPDLVVSFIGYESREVNAAGQSQVDVQLAPDKTQLNEVVVVGYSRAAREEDKELPYIELAEPDGGRRLYKQYLKKNLHYPSQAIEKKIEGTVTIEFNVEATGGLSDFSIVKGLDNGCNEEVIRLIKEGTAWKPSTQDGKPVQSRVQVEVKFKLPK